MLYALTEEQREIVATVKRFVQQKILPVASELEHRDEYPDQIVEEMKALGLFGATISPDYGGLGLDLRTYALIVEEICRGWMSVSGILNTHILTAYMLEKFGTAEQRTRFLPDLAKGERRGGMALTEPHAGSDLQAIRTTAVRRGDEYCVTGSKMFVTNGRWGSVFSVLVKTDHRADPPHRGMGILILEKGMPGFSVSRDIHKLGYRGVETCELILDDVPVPARNLLGGREGEGFKQIMSALEVGRINVAARGVGVARAAFEDAIRYAQQRTAFGKPICEHQAIQLKLADMGTKIEAARLLTLAAAAKKDRGERCDLEAGMAKLFATETCQEVVLEAMRVLGGYGYTTEFAVERYYRDAPLLIIGEGTNEIQRLVIARGLLKRYRI